jgi:alkylhydroperoxidase family enzyme
MARTLQEIEWGAPLLESPPDAEYETGLMKKLNPWLRRVLASLSDPIKISYATPALSGIAYFVTSQENACRYCYGVARAAMKIWGYSEKRIQDLEQLATLADGVTRRVVEFARKLAKSNPSPARQDREALQAEGLKPEAVAELAAIVVVSCFANRTATFLALPPNLTLEKLPASLLSRIFSPFIKRKLGPIKVPPPEDFRNAGPCAPIIAAAGRTHLATWLRRVTDGCLGSPVIPRRSKLLMLAVIARQLGSRLCEEETRESLAEEGLAKPQTDAILATLGSPALTSVDERLLRWTRETVWYEPRVIQNSTRRLLSEIGEELTLEAIGTAALCNTLARLSLVRQ